MFRRSPIGLDDEQQARAATAAVVDDEAAPAVAAPAEDAAPLAQGGQRLGSLGRGLSPHQALTEAHEAHVARSHADVFGAWQQDPDRDARLQRGRAAESTRDAFGKQVAELGASDALTHEQAAEIAAVRGQEHDLEIANNLDLREGRRADGSAARWSGPELGALESMIGKLPSAHVAGNAKLERFERAGVSPEGGDEAEMWGASHGSGTISLFDAGAAQSPAQIEQILTHEVGHSVHDAMPKQFAAYQKAAGWRSMDNHRAKLTAAEAGALQGDRGRGWRERQPINKGGENLMVDPYDPGKTLAVSDTAIPGGDAWAYGATHPKEQFAEHYKRSVHDPLAVHRDLVHQPQQQVDQDQFKIQMAREQGADPARLANLEAAAKRSQQAQRQRKGQFDIMRNDVFGTHTATDEAAARMAAGGASPEQLAAFRAEAAKYSTPAQIAALEGGAA